MKKNKIFKIIAIIIPFLIIGAFFFWSLFRQKSIKVSVFKAPTCGCCVKYISYLKNYGFKVETIDIEDMSSIKKKYQIPENMESCHTAVIDNYFFEGHIPIEAIKKFLTEKPAIDGIALPGMPSGSPGMPGLKLEAFEIYGLLNGQISKFTTL